MDPALLEAKKDKKDKGQGCDAAEDTPELPRVKPQCGPGATRDTWPEDDVHVCEEDHRCCDVAKFYGVDLELLVEKNKSRYKALNKVIRLKAGTILLLPLPGETKESIAAAEAREKERLKKKRKLEDPKDKGADGTPARDKKAKSGKGAAPKAKGKSEAEAEAEPEESVEQIMARATEQDTPQVSGFRQVSITDRLPFNVTRPETEPHKWDEYRDSTLNAASFEDLGAQLSFMEGQILSGALRAEWEAEHRAGFADKCKQAKTAKEIQLCMQELFMEAIDWAAVDRHWDLIEDEEAAAQQEDENEAPAALAKRLAYSAEAVPVYVEDDKAAGGKREGRLYIGRHPKTGAPIWMVEVHEGGGDKQKGKRESQQLKASAFAQLGTGAKSKTHFLHRIFLVNKASTQAKTSGASAKCLHDWLVEEGYMGKLEVVGGQSIFSMRSIPADVESKLAQGMTRMMQLIDRVPFAAVKNKKQDLWVAYGNRIVAAGTPAQLALELKWFADQLVTKVLASWWISSAKGPWEVSCDRVVALKDFYMVLMELEDDAINWKAVDARWVTENVKGQELEGGVVAGGEKRTHKKKEKVDAGEGVCPLPLPVPQAAARLPEGWKVEVKSCTVWRPEECYVVFRTPDGYHLHSIDHVLKYYQKQKMLPSFSESVRKGFVAAQQEARAVHNKHMQRIAKFLLPMPDIPIKFLDDAKDMSISRETRLLERTARQDKVPSPKAPLPAPRPATSATAQPPPPGVVGTPAPAAAITTSAPLAASATSGPICATGAQGGVPVPADASAPSAAAQSPAPPAAAAEKAASAAAAEAKQAVPAAHLPAAHVALDAAGQAPLLPSPKAAPPPAQAPAAARDAADAPGAASALPTPAAVQTATGAGTETAAKATEEAAAPSGVGKKRPRDDEGDAGEDVE